MEFRAPRDGSPSFRTPFSQVPLMSANSQPPSSSPGQPQGTFIPIHPQQQQPFDIFEWYPRFQSCLQYFLDRAQHEGAVQAVAAFVNIQLPFQKSHHPISSYRASGSPTATHAPSTSRAGAAGGLGPMHSSPPPSSAPLVPYIRRLVVTGFDHPPILHGFFGDDWAVGIGQIHETERRNYLFAAKSASWMEVKKQYDMPDGQYVPFLKPLHNVTEKEILHAELQWSDWLAMQDWMIGPRAPEATREAAVMVKSEEP